MDAATMRCPLSALVGLVIFSLFGSYVLSATGADPSRLRANAEQSAARQLGAAGFPWASLVIADDVGRLVGEAPTVAARVAAVAAAQVALKPMMGIPGVFARLSDEMTVNAASRDESQAVSPDGQADLAPSPAGQGDTAARPEVPPPVSSTIDSVTDAASIVAAHVPNAQVQTNPSGLAPWTGPATPQWSHEVYVYPPTGRPSNADTPATTATACEADIATLLAGEQIRFAFASATLSSDSDRLLDRIAGVIAGCRGARLAIEGHTDSLGPDDKNLALSRSRAESVRSALLTRGVPAAQLSAIGYGESRPLDSAETDAAWERNRRIEFRVLDAKSEQ
jgi:outer membrane protein OmpA-like peptidoglycan-associated protein